MIIAISQRSMKMDKGANRDALENDYVKYYEDLGITLLPIPNVSKDLDKYFDQIPIKGIILTGGNFSINVGIVMFTRLSVHCADNITTTISSYGF